MKIRGDLIPHLSPLLPHIQALLLPLLIGQRKQPISLLPLAQVLPDRPFQEGLSLFLLMLFFRGLKIIHMDQFV